MSHLNKFKMKWDEIFLFWICNVLFVGSLHQCPNWLSGPRTCSPLVHTLSNLSTYLTFQWTSATSRSVPSLPTPPKPPQALPYKTWPPNSSYRPASATTLTSRNRMASASSKSRKYPPWISRATWSASTWTWWPSFGTSWMSCSTDLCLRTALIRAGRPCCTPSALWRTRGDTW